MKPGREYIDPCGRRVRLLRIVDGFAEVRLAGPYGATVRYPPTVLAPAPEEPRP